MAILVVHRREYLGDGWRPNVRIERTVEFATMRDARRFIQALSTFPLDRLDEHGNRVRDSHPKLVN